ncbi:hypothetical protein D3C71_832050 [compost metagenome]
MVASVARTVKVYAPRWVGVPLITPALRVTPGGGVPACSVKVYGAVPPLALSVCDTAVPAVRVSAAGATTIVELAGVMVTVTRTVSPSVSENSKTSLVAVSPP